MKGFVSLSNGNPTQLDADAPHAQNQPRKSLEPMSMSLIHQNENNKFNGFSNGSSISQSRGVNMFNSGRLSNGSFKTTVTTNM